MTGMDNRMNGMETRLNVIMVCAVAAVVGIAGILVTLLVQG